MILTCPACGTRYLVPDVAIGADGRRVKCSRCGHLWHETAPAASFAAPGPGGEPEPVGGPPPGEAALRAEAIPVSPEPRPRPIPRGSGLPAPPVTRRSLAPWVGWALFGLVVVSILAGLWFGRGPIVAAWPPTERLYSAVGLAAEPPGAGLVIRDIASVRRTIDGGNVVEVEGVLSNPGETPRPLPLLRVTLFDAANAEISATVEPPPVTALGPGETTGFVVRFDDAPGAARATVRFVAPDDRQGRR